MADWSTIANEALDVGSPIRAVDALALRDNPIAIAEGRPGAPRVSPWAAAAPCTARDVTRMKSPLTYSTGSTSFSVMLAAAVMNEGSVRIKATHARISGTGQSRAKITRVRAGVEAELVAETGSSPISYDFNTLEPGDTIFWYLRCQDSGATCTMTNVQVSTDSELLHSTEAFFTFGAEPT